MRPPVINLTIPAGRAPDALVNEALVAVFDEVHDTRNEPPQLEPARASVRAAQRGASPVELDQALRAGAAAHIAALAALRAAYPDLGGPS